MESPVAKLSLLRNGTFELNHVADIEGIYTLPLLDYTPVLGESTEAPGVYTFALKEYALVLRKCTLGPVRLHSCVERKH